MDLSFERTEKRRCHRGSGGNPGGKNACSTPGNSERRNCWDKSVAECRSSCGCRMLSVVVVVVAADVDDGDDDDVEGDEEEEEL